MDRWTLRELASQVAAALQQSGYEAPDNGQIAAVPSARTIRYYTSLGLIDRPAEMRGRTALYDRRHLAQLLAIKQLQVAGKPLAEIQSMLAGAAPAEIERIAKLPEGEGSRAEPEPERDATFWMAEPAEPDGTAAGTAAGTAEPDGTAAGTAARETHETIELAPGLLLVVDRRQHPRRARALQRAAEAIDAALT